MSSLPPGFYCSDNCILIPLSHNYPRHIFVGVWDFIEELCRDDRFFVPDRVWKEYKPRDSNIDTWFKEWVREQKIVRPFTDQLTPYIQQLDDEVPGLFPHPESTKNSADPFVVAQAMLERDLLAKSGRPGEVIVLTGEGRSKPGSSRVKIPDACTQMGIRSFSLWEFLEHEKCVFTRK